MTETIENVNPRMEEQFYAAVNVIKSLPKNGPFEPSHTLKLHFYSLFKQATEGPCTTSRPAFWDVIGRLKYDAWKKLGDMPKETAMTTYVEELKKEVYGTMDKLGVDRSVLELGLSVDKNIALKMMKIVETMSYTGDVANFVHVMGPFYEFISMEKSSSEPSLQNAEHKKSNGHAIMQNNKNSDEDDSSLEVNGPPDRDDTENSLQHEKLNTPSTCAAASDTESDEEDYCDTLSYDRVTSPTFDKETIANSVGSSSSNAHHLTSNLPNRGSEHSLHMGALAEQMRRDLAQITSRICALETTVNNLANQPTYKRRSQVPVWWPFPTLSPKAVIFFMVWPFIVHWVLTMRQRRANR